MRGASPGTTTPPPSTASPSLRAAQLRAGPGHPLAEGGLPGWGSPRYPLGGAPPAPPGPGPAPPPRRAGCSGGWAPYAKRCPRNTLTHTHTHARRAAAGTRLSPENQNMGTPPLPRSPPYHPHARREQALGGRTAKRQPRLPYGAGG